MTTDLKVAINKKNDLFLTENSSVLSEFYDKNAGAFYGEILNIIKQEEVADKVLTKVFLDVFNNNVEKRKYLTPFISVLNHSRKKSLRTVKAIKMFQACGCNPIPISSKH